MREFRGQDAPDLLALNADPEVMRYTGDIPFASEKEVLSFIREYDQYQRYGLGRWSVLEKSSQTFLGWCGLKYLPETAETDVGFRLARAHWNKGFATEAALACLRYGFEDKELTAILGRAARANHSSIRVLEKLGMSYSSTLDFNGMEGVCYRITRSEFILRDQSSSDSGRYL